MRLYLSRAIFAVQYEIKEVAKIFSRDPRPGTLKRQVIHVLFGRLSGSWCGHRESTHFRFNRRNVISDLLKPARFLSSAVAAPTGDRQKRHHGRQSENAVG